MRSVRWVPCVLAAALIVGGCTSYYRVTDPASGNIYYTKDIDNQKGGAVTLKDAATGDKVTLQNSQISKVSKEEYETNRAGKH
jgi:hypothetical protein